MFAHIFGDAIKLNGLVASQVEHPGYYYLEAAQKLSQRKRLREDLVVEEALSNIGVVAKASVYVGKAQFGFTPELPNNGKPDGMSAKDFDAVCLTILERQQNHCNGIVGLATKAKAYFETFNVIKVPSKDKQPSPTTPLTRMAAWLDVYIARELYDLDAHLEALNAVEAAITLYRKEQWSTLLVSTLHFSYRCAYSIGNVNLFSIRALELSGGNGSGTDEHRRQFLRNFTDVCAGTKPTPTLADPLASTAWDSAFDCLSKDPIAVDMDQLALCIECKVRFRKNEFSVKEDIEMIVAFRSWLPNDLSFNKICASFDQPSYEGQKILCDGRDAEQPRILKAGATTVFKLNFSAADTDGHVLNCKHISINSGSSPGAVLLWSDLADASEGSSNAKADISADAMSTLKWSPLCNQPTAKMTPLPSLVNMSFEHDDPALFGENYLVEIKCKSEETSAMSRVCIKMSLLEDDKPSESGHFVKDGKEESQCTFELDSLDAGGTTQHKIYLSFTKRCDVVLAVSFEYSTKIDDSDADTMLRRSKEYKEKIKVIDPFEFTADIETSQFFESESIQPGKTFLVVAKLLSEAPVELRVVSCSYEAAEGADEQLALKETSTSNFVQLIDVTVSKEEELTDCGSFVVGNKEHKTPLSLGALVLEWSRAPGEDSTGDMPTYKTRAKLPEFAVLHAPLLVEVHSAAVGHVQELFPVTYCISNQSTQVQEVEFNIEPHDPFIYSGCQHATVRILPADIGADGELIPTCLKLNYNLFPLRGGFATLPLLTVTSKRTEVS